MSTPDWFNHCGWKVAIARYGREVLYGARASKCGHAFYVYGFQGKGAKASAARAIKKMIEQREGEKR